MVSYYCLHFVRTYTWMRIRVQTLSESGVDGLREVWMAWNRQEIHGNFSRSGMNNVKNFLIYLKIRVVISGQNVRVTALNQNKQYSSACLKVLMTHWEWGQYLSREMGIYRQSVSGRQVLKDWQKNLNDQPNWVEIVIMPHVFTQNK